MNTPESGSTAARARVLVVDDHHVMRRGLTEMLNQQPDLTVGAAVGSVHAALDMVHRESFDLAIVDISLGNGDGIELACRLKSERPGLVILMLSMHEEEHCVERAIRAGASGFVAKQHAGEILLSAVRQVLRGEHFFNHLPSGLRGLLPPVHRPST